MTGVCTIALLDGGPRDGDRVGIPAATESSAHDVVVNHDGTTHRYAAATGPIAERWRQTGVALYTWQRP